MWKVAPMKSNCPKKRKNQTGSSLLESMIALILMCLIFFGALQLFQWAMARMFCDYASFYAAKAYSLGYAYRTINKAARVAAIPISGRDEYSILKLPRKTLTNRLRLYMASGNAGVDFPYWDSSGKDPQLKIYLSENVENNHLTGRVTLQNAPYLSEGLGKFLRITQKTVNPSGYTQIINHSSGWSK